MSDQAKVDVLAVMQLASDMLDTGAFEADREAGKKLLLALNVVADLIRTLDDIGALSMARRVGGPDPMDLHELDNALGMAIDMSHAAIAKATGETP